MAEPVLRDLARFKGTLIMNLVVYIIYNKKKTLGQVTQSPWIRQLPNKAKSCFSRELQKNPYSKSVYTSVFPVCPIFI